MQDSNACPSVLQNCSSSISHSPNRNIPSVALPAVVVNSVVNYAVSEDNMDNDVYEDDYDNAISEDNMENAVYEDNMDNDVYEDDYDNAISEDNVNNPIYEGDYDIAYEEGDVSSSEYYDTTWCGESYLDW